MHFVHSNIFCLFFRDVKVKAGEWFFEERAKKYPDEGNHWNTPQTVVHLSEMQNVVYYYI